MLLVDATIVWGNIFHPIAMAGDEKQLPPCVMSAEEERDDGTLINRFVPMFDFGYSDGRAHSSDELSFGGLWHNEYWGLVYAGG